MATDGIVRPNASGPYLKGARERLGLSVREAADRIGCTIVTLYTIEREGIGGETRPKTLTAICATYKLSADRVLDLAAQRAEPQDNGTAAVLREARERLGITQRQAAERAGVSVSTIQRYETRGITYGSSTAHLLAVCHAYGIKAGSVAEMLF